MRRVGGILSFWGFGSRSEKKSSLDIPSPYAAGQEMKEGISEIGGSIRDFGAGVGGPFGAWISRFGEKIHKSVEPTFKERCKTFFGAVGWSMLGVLAVAGTVALAPVLFIFVAIPAAIVQKDRSLLVGIPLFPILFVPGYCFLSAFNKTLRDKLVQEMTNSVSLA